MTTKPLAQTWPNKRWTVTRTTNAYGIAMGLKWTALAPIGDFLTGRTKSYETHAEAIHYAHQQAHKDEQQRRLEERYYGTPSAPRPRLVGQTGPELTPFRKDDHGNL